MKTSELKLFRKRDLAILLVIAFAIYLSLGTLNFSYSFEPAWYIDQRQTGWKGEFALIPPVVTDLNGDGENEVVVITRDMKLKTFAASAPSDDGKIYIPIETNSISLSSLSVQAGRVPVALKTGYVKPYSPTEVRQQSIIVVREDWVVMCYDANLNFQWEKPIAHKIHEVDRMISFYKIDQVSVLLAPLSLKEDSTGVVIVGGSMSLRDPNSAQRVLAEEAILSVGKSEQERHLASELRASLEHFSIYALDAATGHVIWKHDGTEVKIEQYIRSLPQHAYHLDLHDLSTKAQHHAPGFNDWTMFRQSLIAELPHNWRSREDTSLRIAHFVRRHRGADAPSQLAKSSSKTQRQEKKNSLSDALPSPASSPTAIKKPAASVNKKNRDLGRFVGVETPSLAQDALLPHDASEHTEHPNVLVAHTKAGIEVVSLRTGVPITSLALPGGRVTADVDGDGVVDTLVLLETQKDVATHGEAYAHAGGHLHHCMVMAVSGLPPRSQLFNGTICQTRRHLHDPVSALNQGANLPVAVSATPPLIIRTVDERTQKEARHRDVVVAVNNGVITAYNGKSGEFHWQLDSGSRWKLNYQFATAMLFDADALRVDDLGQHDNTFAEILVMGESEMSLVSREGEVLAGAEFPSAPMERPVFGDFDNDGVTDVLIATQDALLGYRMKVVQSTQPMLIVVVIVAVVTAICFASNVSIYSPSSAAGADGNNNAGGLSSIGSSTKPAVPIPKSKRNMGSFLFISRATDEYHMD